MELPKFKYHSNPMATGSIVSSDNICKCCEQRQGFIYVGPAFTKGDLEVNICPWCIADGTAHTKLNVEFTDSAGIGGYGRWENVPITVIHEIVCRTPGFFGWQQEQWWTHCGDAADFLGRAGKKEIESYGQQLIEALRVEVGLINNEEWYENFKALDKESSPTAYVFQCLHCGKLGGYSDCD